MARKRVKEHPTRGLFEVHIGEEGAMQPFSFTHRGGLVLLMLAILLALMLRVL
jgi:hypothetical protein